MQPGLVFGVQEFKRPPHAISLLHHGGTLSVQCYNKTITCAAYEHYKQ